jgi:hypothetical protein
MFNRKRRNLEKYSKLCIRVRDKRLNSRILIKKMSKSSHAYGSLFATCAAIRALNDLSCESPARVMQLPEAAGPEVCIPLTVGHPQSSARSSYVSAVSSSPAASPYLPLQTVPRVPSQATPRV